MYISNFSLVFLGPILTVETVPFHILNVNVTFEVDETCWPVNAQHHILYVTRIFYEYSCPTYEQIGKYCNYVFF